jgi:Arc/MetJ-type ribon-helix-helix transcriptional regulator
MNLEIHNPELVRRVNAQIQRGHFNDADELIEKALDALEGKPLGRRSRRLNRKISWSFSRRCGVSLLTKKWIGFSAAIAIPAARST